MSEAEREREYRLDELAERAGISARTVRYYVQRGLLPAPVFRGRDTAYGEGHLLRLRAIKRLQGQHLPLDEIAAVLAPGEEAARAVLEGRAGSKRARVTADPPDPPDPYEERASGTRCVRWQLAPGIELVVNDDIDEGGRALVERLRALSQKPRTGGSK